MEIVLYTRRGCHLCEAAEDLLAQAEIGVRLVDVDTVTALRDRYGLRVPVLVVDGQTIAEGRFRDEDIRRLRRVLTRG